MNWILGEGKVEGAHSLPPPHADSCLAVPLASPAALSAVRTTELRAWMLAQLLVLQSGFPTAVTLEANGLQDEDELCRTLVSSAERTVSRFNAVTDDCRCTRLDPNPNHGPILWGFAPRGYRLCKRQRAGWDNHQRHLW